MDKPKIYLDSCCFNRPFDNLSQDKIRFECEAVLVILKNSNAGICDVFQSDVLDDEISRMTNLVKKLKVLMLYSSASVRIEINDIIINRAKEFQQQANVKPFDALHLACAEYSNADILLTTDQKFINRAVKSDSNVRVANPAIWLMEVIFND